jgi:S-adenosyl-L-methionine hydrolase (adenosine-forming)
MPSGIVSLLTDFGTKDPFVGVMKAVMLARHPRLSIVDLAHGVGAQDVAEGAFWLERCFRWFPAETVHLAVVDPGVGSARAAVAVSARGHLFVGPDNGLLALVAADGEVRTLDLAALGVGAPGATFHGRDVFAPAAAELAAGKPFAEIGPATRLAVAAPLAPPELAPPELRGAVVSIDRFGNAITNIGAELLPPGAMVRVGAAALPIVRTYSDLDPGQLGALVGSFDTLELAIRDGDAASALGLRRGSPVVLIGR